MPLGPRYRARTAGQPQISNALVSFLTFSHRGQGWDGDRALPSDNVSRSGFSLFPSSILTSRTTLRK
ncbi:hypothetical protein MPTK1_5g16110 [Marchantia polymorpha subsp. ruderalis]|uniref:Uncharacterized protein n=2 Tax=Marchantia polymorpha TaxID=3197 RepID=A0AAF6BIV6_MARPO|nr:hypothetical protein MARPO_1497s0001 [Marchantia polymorpha]BBN11940.1 hypothetical protein Mp_5g16110 [Marchantia polymorpha subsp. ruderalis]|eukprot:PTQ26467.1 hypothetical protein MARPO_1497s0001 [Marchantia polymorpha]